MVFQRPRLPDMKRLILAAAIVAGITLISLAHLPTLVARESAPPPPVLEALPSPAAPGSGEPNLDVGPDGQVYMSWIEPLGAARADGHVLKIAALKGRNWTTPSQVRSGRDFFVNWADFPSVIALKDGTLAAHWLVKAEQALMPTT